MFHSKESDDLIKLRNILLKSVRQSVQVILFINIRADLFMYEQIIMYYMIKLLYAVKTEKRGQTNATLFLHYKRRIYLSWFSGNHR